MIIIFKMISNNQACFIINNINKKIILIKSQSIFNILKLMIIINIEF